MAPKPLRIATDVLSPKRNLVRVRRPMVRVLRTVDDVPVVGRVLRPATQLGMRVIFDTLSTEWSWLRDKPVYEAGLTEALRLLPKGFRPRQVLDSSCGTGMATGVVLDRWPGVKVTGVDISPRMVREASKAHPAATFVAGTVHALPFEDGLFDLVVTVDGMLDADEMLRVLHRKGRLLIVYSKGGTTPISRRVDRVAREFEGHGAVATTHTDGTAHVVIARHSR
jgi:SAM-dependent methyltransferase